MIRLFLGEGHAPRFSKRSMDSYEKIVILIQSDVYHKMRKEFGLN
ncbi:MAG: hypothetical protein VXY34_08130 [Bdellovibrionota bacterium]|nr:hypothetical protein [Bdellovibrionota bacterium]